MSVTLNSKIPKGSLENKWQDWKSSAGLISPNNKRRFEVIVVGTGLAGASAAASLAELGYKVKSFTYNDSPRRAHSIAAQGGINASKNYQNDGDSTYRLFYDTIKGGDYRSREANVYRLAEVANSIIDQCVAQGVPFAREYGGLLDNRSFGGAQVSRTFYARGQTGQQLLLGAYSSLMRQVAAKNVEMNVRSEMLDLIVHDGRAVGVVVRDLLTGEVSSHSAHCVVLATGGYGNVYYLSTNAKMCNASAIWRAHKKGAALANPCYTQIHPTCIPAGDDFQSKLTLMSESLRNDGRVWVPKSDEEARMAAEVPEGERDYYLETKYPAFGNLVPRDVASRNAKTVVDEGRGVGPLKNGVYLDFTDALDRDGEDTIRAKYGNLFDIYQRITGENPYQRPMRIYPATHYTMGGLWVDYELMSNLQGLFVIGEANFSDHGANRLGASALMQGLADGYFVLPYTLGNYLKNHLGESALSTDEPVFKESEAQVANETKRYLSIKGTKTIDHFHRELGKIVWDNIGMSRNSKGLEQALTDIPSLEEEYKKDMKVLGSADGLNQSLEKAGRVSDFFQLAQLMAKDALTREESCGGHFREEHQTPEGEAMRQDDKFSFVSAWEWTGDAKAPNLNKEDLNFEFVTPTQRSYK